ncbi:thiol:disulfide interchange protein DsbA/DsbL [Zhongshania sp.]|jgi:thiol:disulfide interchange protein DsbA|uniref:thiol:disulfide interchange protein DsbA/DsbL n=1 Tax=Zhongshania sp. TaxID=1971902 RepID=UPI001B799FB6|nr:thiol:disulfide interchange protein DsbA/DsbL [Zhongshania sp.]MBQ0797466.1 thiol:disulfide interchange protein DsbA/DsbL [Zhongshania sp.]|tara:strand:- start:462 stop:1166 length:705 start_codon:yes stop_codon:yes gene_type:complete
MFKKMLSLLSVFSFLLLVSACSDGAEPAASKAAQPAASAAAQTQPSDKADVGERFIRIPQPVRTANPDKIEVVEVFWYGCSHCFHFDPMIEAWKKKLAADVDFHRSPAMWNELMVVHAKAYYTALTLGVLDKVHEPIFKAINVDRNTLRDADALAALFTSHSDIDDATFRKTFDSFGVNSQVKQADARARSYGIAGTPELIINGKYRITGRSAGGQAEMLKVADELIAKERAAK